MSKSKDRPLKYEQAVQELEAIIERIESGEIGLEESLGAYENGMKLITHCRAILATAERKIAELTVDEKGKLHAADDDDEAQDDDADDALDAEPENA
ncbi:MAG: exodeoxyribonuclease VII small subunit [Phycisphaeraceae bacterium]